MTNSLVLKFNTMNKPGRKPKQHKMTNIPLPLPPAGEITDAGPLHIAYGYCRVSTDEQDAECTVQKEGIEAARKIMLADFAWGGHFIDPAVSGTTNFRERPAGLALLERVQSGDVIVCHKLDRMSRNLADFANTLRHLNQIGVGVIALDMGINTRTSVGKLVAHILVAIAEWETERRAERTRSGNALRKRVGLSTGAFKWGFETLPADRPLKPSLKLQRFMRQVWEWMNGPGQYTRSQIARYMIWNKMSWPNTGKRVDAKPMRDHNFRLATEQEHWYSVLNRLRLIERSWAKLRGTEYDVTNDDNYTYEPLGDELPGKLRKCMETTPAFYKRMRERGWQTATELAASSTETPTEPNAVSQAS